MDACIWYDWTRFISISFCVAVIASMLVYLAWQRHKSIKEFNKNRGGYQPENRADFKRNELASSRVPAPPKND